MHPDVHVAGVVGVPHPHTGEAVKAFVDELPRNTAGKLVRRRLDDALSVS